MFFNGRKNCLACRFACIDTTEPSRRLDMSDDRGKDRKNNSAKLLTLSESVIRFRHSRPVLRKQVSRVIATISKTKRPSTRALDTTDAGFASFKNADPFQTPHPRPSRSGCFFIRAARRDQVAADPGCACHIRSDAHGATAAACGSDSRDVPLQLGFVNGFTNPQLTDEEPITWP